jgi:hypothetical protein
MKPVPPEILASAPEGTQWFGGPVDKSTMTLRVQCAADECEAVSALLGAPPTESKRFWRLSAPDMSPADPGAQVEWILSRLTSNLVTWGEVTGRYKTDMFCGLFLERDNRGVSLDSRTMAKLSERGIMIGFDIYAP